MRQPSVELDTSWGPMVIQEWWGEVRVEHGLAEGIFTPGEPTGFNPESRFNMQGNTRMDQADLADAVPLLCFAEYLCVQLDAAQAGAREAALAAHRQREAEAEAERVARAALLAERREQCLTEFLGEKGRVRLRGYKRWRPVTVDSVQDPRRDGGYDVRFVYKYTAKHGVHHLGVGKVRSFEVKVGSRYESVWDDGQEDLEVWDRVDREAPAQYDGSLG